MAPTTGVLAVLAVAMADDKEAILSAKAAMDGFPRPLPGDQPVAREKNRAAMDALKEGSYETAIARLNEGIQADPGDAQLRRSLGHALMMSGRLDDARNALVDSVTLDSARGGAWADLGLVLARQGEQDLAAAAFMASVAVSKPEDKAIERLAGLSRSDGDRAVQKAAAKALESRTIRDAAVLAPPS
jgi:Flp pilus assembly protein TadD